MNPLINNWKTIIDTLRDGLLVVDAQGMIIAVNPAAEELTGYRADELIGQTCRILNCTGCKTSEIGQGGPWCRLFDVGKSKDKQCQLTRKDRRNIQILKSASVLRDENGTVIGAVETLTDMSEIARQHQEIINLRKAFHLDKGFHGIIGVSPLMQRLFELIDSVAPSEAPVIIHGESGTGKELVARAIHEASSRQRGPFIKVNCAALNENLLESELFGHVKGAFTGADQTRIGRFEAAHGGTIFLDEVGDIPLSIQVKLLRVLEAKEIERVGDNTPIPVDARLVTATNRNLDALIQSGAFREDFYFRINVFPLHCPPLRERPEDIPPIIQHLLHTINALNREVKVTGLTPDAMQRLTHYSWPGNVRELRNALEYATVLCPGGEIDTQHLPPRLTNQALVRPPVATSDNDDRELTLAALQQARGNQCQAAELLGVSRVTVWKRLKKYGIKPREWQNA